MSDKKTTETAEQFISFIFDFYSLIRRHTVETNQFRIHSHGFTMLYSLRKCAGHAVTMTGLSYMLGVTKQQITKLVNDFEDMGYVRRVRNDKKRRLVYVEITESGLSCLDVMIAEIENEIKTALGNFNESDLDVIMDSTRVLSDLFERDAENQHSANRNRESR